MSEVEPKFFLRLDFTGSRNQSPNATPKNKPLAYQLKDKLLYAVDLSHLPVTAQEQRAALYPQHLLPKSGGIMKVMKRLEVGLLIIVPELAGRDHTLFQFKTEGRALQFTYQHPTSSLSDFGVKTQVLTPGQTISFLLGDSSRHQHDLRVHVSCGSTPISLLSSENKG